MNWIWVIELAVAVVIFRAGMSFRDQQLKDAAIERRDSDNILGVLGPIAAGLLTGEISGTDAEKEAIAADRLAPGAREKWLKMSAQERDELGHNMLSLYKDPVFMAKQNSLLTALSESETSAT